MHGLASNGLPEQKRPVHRGVLEIGVAGVEGDWENGDCCQQRVVSAFCFRHPKTRFCEEDHPDIQIRVHPAPPFCRV